LFASDFTFADLVECCSGAVLKNAGRVLFYRLKSLRITHAATFGPGWKTNRQPRTGGAVMASVQLPNAHRDRGLDRLSHRSDMRCSDMDALREENKQLRELVVQLSEIVVRNVLDRK
jgi:hypothetical protein